MEQLTFDRVGERMYREKLENGLTVCVFPKPEFQKGYAFFATNYGGMDVRFCLDGEWHDTPAGVAHCPPGPGGQRSQPQRIYLQRHYRILF